MSRRVGKLQIAQTAEGRSPVVLEVDGEIIEIDNIKKAQVEDEMEAITDWGRDPTAIFMQMKERILHIEAVPTIEYGPMPGPAPARDFDIEGDAEEIIEDRALPGEPLQLTKGKDATE